MKMPFATLATLATLALLLLLAPQAEAGMRYATTNTTVTTTSGNCLAQNNFRSSLTLDASGSTINIGYCLGNACTAAINTVGTTTLFAGAIDFWQAGSAPSAEICFISASGTPPLTIREGFN